LFEAFKKKRPGEQNPPVTTPAAQTNVRPDSINDPFIAATGMFFSHLYPVSGGDFRHKALL
jgi:hypothetical protein